MTLSCKVCGKKTVPAGQSAERSITCGICAACSLAVSSESSKSELLEAIDAPILLMQGNPRLVITANRRALDLFGKELHEVEGRRGGQVFDCIHSFTEAGCGKDSNCENCKIKNAIVDTFTTARPHSGVSTPLQIKKADGTETCVLQVSTEKVGDLAFVRIERYDNASVLSGRIP